MRETFERLAEIAATDSSVIVEGETGTGKELVSEAIHEHSPRKAEALVVVDCAAIPPELIESELFGHVRGAFTSAVADRKGAFEEAHRVFTDASPLGRLVEAAEVARTCTFLSSDGPSRSHRPDTSMTATHSPVRSRDCA